jgi:hypothetical protein
MTALALLGACATAPVDSWQPGDLRPLIVGWEQFFRVQWGATSHGDQALVEGYITNVWGFPALRLQLLVTGYDASGQKVGQRLAWGPNEIDYGARVYFNVPVPAAATYDVAVFAWSWVQTGNGGDLR